MLLGKRTPSVNPLIMPPSSLFYSVVGSGDDQMTIANISMAEFGSQNFVRTIAEISRIEHGIGTYLLSSHFHIELNSGKLSRTVVSYAAAPIPRALSFIGFASNVSPTSLHNISVSVVTQSSMDPSSVIFTSDTEFSTIVNLYPKECSAYLSYFGTDGFGLHPSISGSPFLNPVTSSGFFGHYHTTFSTPQLSDVLVVAEIGRLQLSGSDGTLFTVRLFLNETVIEQQSFPNSYSVFNYFRVVFMKTVVNSVPPGTHGLRFEIQGAAFFMISDYAGTSETRFFTHSFPIKCFGIPSTHPKVCSGNGQCTAKDTCQCIHGTSGSQCETFTLSEAATSLDTKKWKMVANVTGSAKVYSELPIQQMSLSYYVIRQRPGLVIHAIVHGLSKSSQKCFGLFRILFNNEEIAVTNAVFDSNPYTVQFTGFVESASEGWSNITVQYKLAINSLCTVTFGVVNASQSERLIIIESFAPGLVSGKRVYNATGYAPNSNTSFAILGANSNELMNIPVNSISTSLRAIAEISRIQHFSSNSSFSRLDLALNNISFSTQTVVSEILLVTV